MDVLIHLSAATSIWLTFVSMSNEGSSKTNKRVSVTVGFSLSNCTGFVKNNGFEFFEQLLKVHHL